MMLKGTTKNLGVIGWPVAHSLSPVLQNEAIRRAGIDYVYIALPVPQDKLGTAVAGLSIMQFAGWNVTIPHKTAIMDFLDEVDPDAKAVGAVNTVVNRDGHLTGYNTDVGGFLGALLAEGFDPAGRKVVLLGAGGAARAAWYALWKQDAAKITIGVRNVEKGEAFLKSFDTLEEGSTTSSEVFAFDEEAFHRALGAADLVVNTTPLGMAPDVDGMPPIDLDGLKDGAFVYDIIYTPQETRLLREARERGHCTLNGERMLVLQGAAALRLWTGIDPDTEAMGAALHAALIEKSMGGFFASDNV